MNELLWFGFGALAMLVLVAMWVGAGLPSFKAMLEAIVAPWEAFKNRNRK